MADGGAELRAAVIACLTIAWIAVLLRCWVRIRIVKAFALDDWLALVSLFFVTLDAVFKLLVVRYGAGKHIQEVGPEMFSKGMEAWVFCELFYVLATVPMRLAVGCLILRIAVRDSHKWVVHGLNFINVVVSLFYAIIVLVQCRPLSYFWTRFKGEGEGTCINPEINVNSTYALSAMSVFVDWSFGLLPILIVWDLNMDRRRKILVGLVLGLGVFACTATIIRMPYIVTLVRTNDFLHATVGVAMWSYTEAGIGLAAVSLVTLRPLVRSFLAVIGLSSASRESAMPMPYDKDANGRPKPNPAGRGRARSQPDIELANGGIRPGMGYHSTVESGANTLVSQGSNGSLCERTKEGEWLVTSTRTLDVTSEAVHGVFERREDSDDQPDYPWWGYGDSEALRGPPSPEPIKPLPPLPNRLTWI